MLFSLQRDEVFNEADPCNKSDPPTNIMNEKGSQANIRPQRQSLPRQAKLVRDVRRHLQVQNRLRATPN
jgi:hypothetical protein